MWKICSYSSDRNYWNTDIKIFWMAMTCYFCLEHCKAVLSVTNHDKKSYMMLFDFLFDAWCLKHNVLISLMINFSKTCTQPFFFYFEERILGLGKKLKCCIYWTVLLLLHTWHDKVIELYCLGFVHAFVFSQYRSCNVHVLSKSCLYFAHVLFMFCLFIKLYYIVFVYMQILRFIQFRPK